MTAKTISNDAVEEGWKPATKVLTEFSGRPGASSPSLNVILIIETLPARFGKHGNGLGCVLALTRSSVHPIK